MLRVRVVYAVRELLPETIKNKININKINVGIGAVAVLREIIAVV
jgi:hypothetical protein